MCCIMAMQSEGRLDHNDLNQLTKSPEDLEFEFALLTVIQVEECEKEGWQEEAGEKLESVPHFKEEGSLAPHRPRGSWEAGEALA